METLRKELYKFIEKYGCSDPKTIEISQKLDIEVNKDMKNKIQA